LLNTRCYDVIVCDVNLSGELGTDIAEKILERDPTQPIYLMSEYTGSKVREEAARIGLELQRKLSHKDPDEFAEEIKKLLDKRPCDTPIAPAPGALGEAAAAAGQHGQHGSAAATRGNPVDVNGDSAEKIQRPQKSIQLTSPHVLAVRASLT